MSITNPLMCGYVKFVWYEVVTKQIKIEKNIGENEKQFIGRIREKQYTDLQNIFGETLTGFKYTNFKKHCDDIVKYVQDINKRNVQLKTDILNMFSSKNWITLDNSVRSKHSFEMCEG